MSNQACHFRFINYPVPLTRAKLRLQNGNVKLHVNRDTYDQDNTIWPRVPDTHFKFNSNWSNGLGVYLGHTNRQTAGQQSKRRDILAYYYVDLKRNVMSRRTLNNSIRLQPQIDNCGIMSTIPRVALHNHWGGEMLTNTNVNIFLFKPVPVMQEDCTDIHKSVFLGLDSNASMQDKYCALSL